MEERAEVQDYILELTENIINGNYNITEPSNIQEINAVLNNDNIMDGIMIALTDYYGDEGTEAESRYDAFVDYNNNIVNNFNNRENLNENENRIIIDNNLEDEEDEEDESEKAIEIPEDVLNKIPEPVLQVITCPISGEIMRNPVVNSVGQTYDKASIKGWISRGNRTDPNTRQQITTTLIPNFSIKSLINSYIPQLGGKRKYTKKNRKNKKSRKVKTNKRTKNIKKIKKMKNKTIKQKKVLKNKKYNKKTKIKRK